LGFKLPIPAILAILAISFAALCLRPSATDPTPLDVLLKTRAQPQFDRAVDRTVEAIFHVFQGSNRRQFSALFLVSAVLSAEGRNGLEVLLLADC